MKKFILFFLLLFLFMIKINAEDVTPDSTSSILIENSTGKILYKKNENEKIAPASMTKIMTLLIVMENIDNGTIKYSDKVTISKNASSMGGSQIYINENEILTVKELIKGVAIASANDASVALAEYIGGTEDNFVTMMNEKAKELNLKNTVFKNPHGLDEDGHVSSAYDLSIMARELLKHSDILKFTSKYEEYMNKPNGDKFWLVNTNKLIRAYPGMDGLKTGYTKNSGYGLTGTALKNNMRLISVVMKSKSVKTRSSDTVKLMEYGFNLYNASTVVKNTKKLGNVYIRNSKKGYYPYYTLYDVKQIVKKGKGIKNAKYEIKLYNLKAPITKKQVIGKLILKVDNKKVKYDLITNKNIKKTNYFYEYINNLKNIVSGKISFN